MKYKKILLKLSGEGLMGEKSFGLDENMLNDIAREIKIVHDAGVQIALVIGGGNIFRGLKGAAGGMDRVRADHMGMLATVINSLAMQDALHRAGVPARGRDGDVEPAGASGAQARRRLPLTRRGAGGDVSHRGRGGGRARWRRLRGCGVDHAGRRGGRPSRPLGSPLWAWDGDSCRALPSCYNPLS